MEIRDYNGSGRWSVDAVIARYRDYCRTLNVSEPAELRPARHGEGAVTWIHPVMFEVIAAAERGDQACVAIAVEFIEEVEYIPFRKSLKSRAARALRRTQLSGTQVERVRERVVKMLIAGMVPREFREYSKLLRSLGVGPWWPVLEEQIPRDNPYAMHYFNYLRMHRESQRV